MPKRIDKKCDNKEAGIRFHTSSARLAINKVSFVAFQKFMDDMERSMFLCPDCGWQGWGKGLVPMEQDEHDSFTVEHEAYTWYACPACEAEIPVDLPVMRMRNKVYCEFNPTGGCFAA